jgi:hypothetical protein
MTNHKKIISLLLFIVACRSADSLVAGQNINCSSIQHMQSESRRFEMCLDRQDRLKTEKRLQLPLLSEGVGSEEELICKLLEEIVKNETERQKSQDRQADILEKLLLESTISEAASNISEPQ